MSTRPCKACGTQIIWIKSTAGRAIPCNSNLVYYKRTRHGNTKVMLHTREVITAEIARGYEDAEGYGYIPHWGTCTNPDKFRKERKS